MEEISFLKKNNFSEIIKFLEKYENKENALRDFVLQNSDKNGIVLLSLLLDIAYRKNTAFWFINIAYLYSFEFHFITGAQKASLFYFKKAHELNKNNESILEAILDFQLPPEIILSNEEAILFTNRLLEINPNNQRALKIIKNR